jgi:hypothetical protein
MCNMLNGIGFLSSDECFEKEKKSKAYKIKYEKVRK